MDICRPRQKMKLDLNHTLYTKFNSKRMKDLNVKCKTIKFSGRNKGKSSESKLRQRFLRHDAKRLVKGKIDLIKIICSVKHYIKKMKAGMK